MVFFVIVRLIVFTSNVVWLADTNYRIDLDNETARSLATRDGFDAMLSADQVCRILIR